MAQPPPRLRIAYEHLRAGRLPAARAAIESVLRRAPADTDANSMMCWVLREAGEPERALYFARRALEGAPGDPNLTVNVANLLARTGDVDAAIASYERARAAAPEHEGALVGLSAALGAAHRLDEALEVARAGLARAPGSAKHTANAASALLYMGRAREAVALLRDALRGGSDAGLLRALCICGLYAGNVSPEESLEAHRRWAALLVRDRAAPPPRRPGTGSLRVGLVSGDFRRHSCAFFIEPLLEHLDPERFPLTCYSTSSVADDVTARLRQRAGAWRDVASWPAERLLSAVRADRIEVLIDLSGLTDGNRLDVFARRAAPVQVTWLGYPSTTGVAEMDRRVADRVTDPPGDTDGHAVERTLRLEGCCVCYRPPANAPEAARAPDAGPFTFGAFNALSKLDDSCVALWAGALNAAPGTRLLIRNRGLASPAVRAATIRRFREAGVDPARITAEPPVESQEDVLRGYARVDAALDTFPYNGTTTTCEALLMGVPVVTLSGRTTASRMGASLLTAAGMAEWVAPDAPRFCDIAAGLSRQGPRVASGRGDLHARFRRSAACDGPAFAAAFGAALGEACIPARG